MRLAGHDYGNIERGCFVTIDAKISRLAPDSPLQQEIPFAHAPSPSKLSMCSTTTSGITASPFSPIAYSEMQKH